MSDIELIIKIPERIRVAILNGEYCGILDDRIYNAIKDGTPLPKGCERLMDVGQCDRKLFYQQCGGADSLITVKSAFDMLMSLPTIIVESGDNK